MREYIFAVLVAKMKQLRTAKFVLNAKEKLKGITIGGNYDKMRIKIQEW